MSCEGHREQLCHLAETALADLSATDKRPTLKLDQQRVPVTAETLERMFLSANNQVNMRQVTEEQRATLRDKTLAVMRLFDQAGLKRPSHTAATGSEGQMPKAALWPGYAALHDVLHYSPAVTAAVNVRLTRARAVNVLPAAARKAAGGEGDGVQRAAVRAQAVAQATGVPLPSARHRLGAAPAYPRSASAALQFRWTRS